LTFEIVEGLHARGLSYFSEKEKKIKADMKEVFSSVVIGKYSKYYTH